MITSIQAPQDILSPSTAQVHKAPAPPEHHGTQTFELHTADGGHLYQPSTTQLADAIARLAAPGNTFLWIQPKPDTGWYAEICLPDPATADVFDGTYEIHFQDDDSDPPKWTTSGDTPETIARHVSRWVRSMMNSRL